VNVRIEPLKLRHLTELGQQEYAKDTFDNKGKAYAVLVDNKVVAIGGISVLWEKVGRAWTLMTEDAKSSPLIMRRIHQAIKIMLPVIRDGLGLERIEADALPGTACAWLERFGFKQEGAMPKYKDGRTFIRYGWTNG